MIDINCGTIEQDLILMEGRLRSMRLQLAKEEELIINARLFIAQLKGENDQLRHRQCQPEMAPVSEDEVPF